MSLLELLFDLIGAIDLATGPKRDLFIFIASIVIGLALTAGILFCLVG